MKADLLRAAKIKIANSMSIQNATLVSWKPSGGWSVCGHGTNALIEGGALASRTRLRRDGWKVSQKYDRRAWRNAEPRFSISAAPSTADWLHHEPNEHRPAQNGFVPKFMDGVSTPFIDFSLGESEREAM